MTAKWLVCDGDTNEAKLYVEMKLYAMSSNNFPE